MILERIAHGTRARVEYRKRNKPIAELKKDAFDCQRDDGFIFEDQLARSGINFICEVKKASPSRGIISPDYPYVDIARQYEQASAAAISVVTEPDFFLGSDQHLSDIRRHVSVPLLRKDFTVDEYQIYEAKVLGASAVLLICTLLPTEVLQKYLAVCDRLGLSALVEVHDEKEIESALTAGARIVGVNNRSLKDFTVDIDNSIRLRQLVPDPVLFVAESGIRDIADINALRQARVNGVLIGEALMLSSDRITMLSSLRGEKANDQG